MPADWSRGIFDNSTDHGSEVMVLQFVSLFPTRNFPQKVNGNGRQKLSYVIVKNKLIDNIFPWSVLLSTVEMTSKIMFKTLQ